MIQKILQFFNIKRVFILTLKHNVKKVESIITNEEISSKID